MKCVLALGLLVCLLWPRLAAAQFTIPNNDQSGIASDPQSIWMQTDVDALVTGIAGNGIRSGCAVTPQSTPDLTVAVSAGVAMINGLAVTIAGGTSTFATGSTLARVDLLTVNASGTLVVTRGTPATTPAMPALPATSVTCAAIYLPASATQITTPRIVDKRVLVPVAVLSPTAPTISSGFGTSPSIPSNNGTAAFTINVGTGGTVDTGVIGLPAAPTGWNCFVNNLATTATVFVTHQIAGTTTTATISNYDTTGTKAAWGASDILRVSCFKY